jgi:hypothetical protein
MEGFSMSKVRTTAVDLFTPDEHAILAEWFERRPPAVAEDIPPDEAISRLGFDKETHFYRRIDAAVAFIVLERAEQRLPQWSAIRDDKLILGRERRGASKIPNRKVLLQPRHLFTINWADSGPGYSWPTAYYVTWLPYYDRYVVTASADCPDAFGYCDFALGAFGIDTPIEEGARKIICADWYDQKGWGQQRWAYLFSTELISKQQAEAWAEQVWPSERSEEECLEEKPVETAGRQTQQPTYPVIQKQQQSPPPPARPPSKTLSDERERLVAEIKRHHPKATTEQIVRDLEAWGE